MGQNSINKSIIQTNQLTNQIKILEILQTQVKQVLHMINLKISLLQLKEQHILINSSRELNLCLRRVENEFERYNTE